MTIGAGQAIVFGLCALGLTLAGRASSVDVMDRAVRGLGKLFWMRGFEPQLYGQGELTRLSAARA